MAGDDVAFAEAINLTGQLQINNKIIIKWENKLTHSQPQKRIINKKHYIPFLSLNNHRKSTTETYNNNSANNSANNSSDSNGTLEDCKNNNEITFEDEIIPFILG